MEWFDFKKTFTKEQEDAIWQYFIDHSAVQPNGNFRIYFHVKDVDDFWYRVFGRYTGDFVRYGERERSDIEFAGKSRQSIANEAHKALIYDKYFDVFTKNIVLRHLFKWMMWYARLKTNK